MPAELAEPLRDRVGRVLYEEPGKNCDWYKLSEERREPWRKDADRAIAVALEGRITFQRVEAAAGAMVAHMFAEHELPVDDEIWRQYVKCAEAALQAAEQA